MSGSLDTAQALVNAIQKATKIARALRRANDSMHVKKDTPSLLIDAAEVLEALSSNLQALVMSEAEKDEIIDGVISSKIEELKAGAAGAGSKAPSGAGDPPAGGS